MDSHGNIIFIGYLQVSIRDNVMVTTVVGKLGNDIQSGLSNDYLWRYPCSTASNSILSGLQTLIVCQQLLNIFSDIFGQENLFQMNLPDWVHCNKYIKAYQMQTL